MIFAPLGGASNLLGLLAITGGITLALFGGVGLWTRGWTVFTWVPLLIILTIYGLALLNLAAFRAARLQVWLTLAIGGIISPLVAVAFAIYVLLAFGEPALPALGVGTLTLVLIFGLGLAEGRHCDPSQTQAALRKSGKLRALSATKEGFDTHWEWSSGANANVPGLGWRKWLDRAVIAFAVIAMPLGVIGAYTSTEALPEIPVQWGVMIAFLVVAWLLRPLVTAVFGQLSFLRSYTRGT